MQLENKEIERLNMKVGIIGLGTIGKKLCEYLSEKKIEIIAFNHRNIKEKKKEIKLIFELILLQFYLICLLFLQLYFFSKYLYLRNGEVFCLQV